MRGAPSLRRRDIVLAAPVLRFDLVQGRLAGTGGFALYAEGLEVVAERGVYEADFNASAGGRGCGPRRTGQRGATTTAG